MKLQRPLCLNDPRCQNHWQLDLVNSVAAHFVDLSILILLSISFFQRKKKQELFLISILQ